MAKSVKQPVETPPYLKQVRIRDYAPLRDAKADFKPGLNIIIGSNGVGKTRFLSLTNNLINLYDRNHIDGLGCEIIVAGPYEIKVKYIEQNDTTKGNQIPNAYAGGNHDTLLVSANYGLLTVEEPNLYEAIQSLTDDRFYIYSNVLVQHGVPSPHLLIIDESSELILRVTKRRLASFISLDNASRTLDKVASRLVQDFIHVIIRAFRIELREQDSAIAIDAEDARTLIIHELNAYLSAFSYYLPLYSPINAVRCSEFFQVYKNPIQDELIIKGLILEFQVNGAWLPFSSLSDGTKRLFYTITEILSPLGESGKREIPKIIFLEEPELGIHPDQLQKLLTLIREVSEMHQVIMTTHSPQVLDMLRKDELDRITICELDPIKGTQFRKLSAAKKAKAKAYMRDDSYLSDFWRFSTLEDPD